MTNPLDFSQGFPPTLLVKDNDSLAEEVQRAFPRARVVKTLNTVTADVMVRPETVGGGASSLFMSGNDRGEVHRRRSVERVGWRDVIDLGDISTARGPEMYLPLWLRVMGSLGTAMFNITVER